MFLVNMNIENYYYVRCIYFIYNYFIMKILFFSLMNVGVIVFVVVII